MPFEFQITTRPAGIALNAARPGETVRILARELLGPREALLVDRLAGLHDIVFSKIPELPAPSAIDHIVVIIRSDLGCTAYVNELSPIAKARVSRPIEAGSPVFVSDVTELASVDLGVEIPLDAAVIVMRSFGWKRSLFFDFVPLSAGRVRDLPLEQALVQQAMLLFDIPAAVTPGESIDGSPHTESPGEPSAETTSPSALDGSPNTRNQIVPSANASNSSAQPPESPVQTRVRHWEGKLTQLKALLASRCETEREYQEFLDENGSWVFRSRYGSLNRHPKLDDTSIPDFVATRNGDEYLDVIEIKQPFVSMFRRDGEFSAAFNDACNQAEQYLIFTERQRPYLRDKGLRFENPECLLIMGYGLSEREIEKTKAIESSRARRVRVVTYDQLIKEAEAVIQLARYAVEPVLAVTFEIQIGEPR